MFKTLELAQILGVNKNTPRRWAKQFDKDADNSGKRYAGYEPIGKGKWRSISSTESVQDADIANSSTNVLPEQIALNPEGGEANG